MTYDRVPQGPGDGESTMRRGRMRLVPGLYREQGSATWSVNAPDSRQTWLDDTAIH
jgi:hypothetical protein